MLIHGIQLDAVSNQPVIILRDLDYTMFLPIWIGQFEATSILMKTEGIKPARPLTHDLLKNITEALGGKVQRVVINDISNGTFYARIHVLQNEVFHEIDSRPSDAIALAVRLDVPIFATRHVLEQAAIVTKDWKESEIEEFKAFLDKINPEDFKE